MSTNYADFLAAKAAHATRDGITVPSSALHPGLHDWQREIVSWALHVGRAAIWADTGLGKTRMQVEWLRHIAGDGIGVIVAPLAVCHQTVREAAKIGATVTYTREPPSTPGLWIMNYEMIDRLDPDRVAAVVLDESSILKQSDGKMRAALIDTFASVPYRLSCTATPAPNDPEELTSQAEFLGQMSRAHMLAAYFIHDDQGWRLKGHARRPMYQWMATWALAIRRPSDLGYPDTGYDLPGLKIIPELVHVDLDPGEYLFAADLGGVGGRAKIRRETLNARVGQALDVVNAEPAEPWLLWCGLNAEADMLADAIPGAVNVHGSLTPDEKAEHLLGFADGKIRVLITKPSIASQGLNYQHCARMAFVGLNDSYETYYQAIRRCYRYGQHRVVHAHVVLSELEQQIAHNIKRKEREASKITAALVGEMRAIREGTQAA